LDRGRAVRLARSFIPVIQAFDNDLIEEMKGIAEGAGADFEEILSINVRTELMYPDQLAEKGNARPWPPFPKPPPQETCSLGKTGTGSPNSWRLRFSCAWIRIKKPTVLTLTEAGIVGKIGFNSAGLGACLNILKSSLAEVGIPIHILMRGS